MNASASFFAVLAIAAAFLLGTQFPHLLHPQHPSGVADDVRRLDLQRMCAEQADKSYKTEYPNGSPKDVIDTYTDHYNTKLVKCLIMYHTENMSGISTTGKVITSEQLDDGFEGSSYGMFTIVHETKPAPSDRIVMCRVQAPGDDLTACHSQAEWESLTGHYMRE